MKAVQIINAVDSMKPNEIGEDVKFGWLGEADARVRCEIAGELPENISPIMGGDDELYVKSPYSRMYSEYLLAMIFFVGGEYDAYLKAYSAYEKTFVEYAKYCIRSR